MSAISFAKSAALALRGEKPHSSITDWVDILTSINYEEEAYDGIPELVDAINLQGLGPAEASRAIRKKLKHGDTHHQYRALVILGALVENCGHKFQTTFADGHLTDALKNLATDPTTDLKVKKKLFAVLASWNAQFKSDPSMSLVANLYKQCRPPGRSTQLDRTSVEPPSGSDFEKKRAKKEEDKKRAKREKEEARTRREDEAREREKIKNKNKVQRPPFNFEKEKPQVLTCIANSSQASSNLINAMTLVNRETDSIVGNERVRDCLQKAIQARKPIVRYIQLVENEELIGTLIETNDRVVAAIEMYDKLAAISTDDVSSEMQTGLAATHISVEGELNKLQDKQRAAIERAKRGGGNDRGKGDIEAEGGHLHPDLQDLSFGPLGSEQNNLPPPLRPSAPGHTASESDSWQRRGSLSDFSDYESSDENTRNTAGSSRRPGRYYVDVSDDPDEEMSSHVRPKVGGAGKLVDVEDPFADPFA